MSHSVVSAYAVPALALAALASVAMGQGSAMDQWRAAHAADDKYEGTGAVVEVANPKIELVSFLAKPFPASIKNTTLQLFFYMPQPSPVHVWARERRVKENYWMEPKAPSGGWKPGQWNSYCGWKSAPLLEKTVPPDNLGVIARLDDDHPRSGVVAPVMLAPAGQPLPTQISEYEAAFRLGIQTAEVSYAVMAGCKGFDRRAGDSVGIKNGGDVFAIPFQVPTGLRGDVSLVVTAKSVDLDVSDERRFCFVHAPVPPSSACPAK